MKRTDVSPPKAKLNETPSGILTRWRTGFRDIGQSFHLSHNTLYLLICSKMSDTRHDASQALEDALGVSASSLDRYTLGEGFAQVRRVDPGSGRNITDPYSPPSPLHSPLPRRPRDLSVPRR